MLHFFSTSSIVTDSGLRLSIYSRIPKSRKARAAWKANGAYAIHCAFSFASSAEPASLLNRFISAQTYMIFSDKKVAIQPDQLSFPHLILLNFMDLKKFSPTTLTK